MEDVAGMIKALQQINRAVISQWTDWPVKKHCNNPAGLNHLYIISGVNGKKAM